MTSQRIYSGPNAKRRASGPQRSAHLTAMIQQAQAERRISEREVAGEVLCFLLGAVAGMGACVALAWLCYGGAQ